jgi:uncharacterized protein involved in exopolysaccharide biosynthesis
MDREIALAPLWERVKARRRNILILVLVSTAVVAGIAFILKPWYRAETELLPPSEEESGVGVASLLRGMGMPGVKIPTEVAPGDVFMVILQSRGINEQMVERFHLRTRYKKKLMEDAIKELKAHARFKQTAAGTIQISVEDTDRQRAADMANSYVEFLDKFNREVRTSKGRRTRVFIEGRLAETKKEMAEAEQRLALYQAKHKTIALTPQMSSAVEQGARLYGRRMALEVRLGVVRNYSSGSDEETQIRQELAETGIELARMVRDVKAQEQVFALLTAQYEDARVTEARDVVTVDVLDAAKPPERKARPRKGIMIGLTFLLSLAVGVGHALLQQEPPMRARMRAVAGQ